MSVMGSKTCHLEVYIYLHFSLLFAVLKQVLMKQKLILSWRSKEKKEKRNLNEHVPLELHMQWRVRFDKKHVWKKSIFPRAYLLDT